MSRTPTRRRFLESSALVSLAAVAGCVSSGDTGASGSAAGTVTGTVTPTASAPTTPPADLDAWLEDVNGYDGEPERFAPLARPSVWVGDPTDDGIAFSPPVIEIAPQTHVTWDWAGHGGQHNVVALDGTFDSGRTNGQAGTMYRYYFEEPGVHPYVCEPHREDGMKGAVVVSEPPSTGNEVVDDWMGHSDTFDGEILDRTGADTVTVTAGAEGGGGHFAFAPDVVRVSAGTTVSWEWSGEGGGHNVVFEEADVSSGDPVAEAGVHFEHTFEESGTYLYACLPHEGVGMRGAVVVE